MTAQIDLTVDVKLRWWVRPYLMALVLFCASFRTVPDLNKVTLFVTRYGIKVKIR